MRGPRFGGPGRSATAGRTAALGPSLPLSGRLDPVSRISVTDHLLIVRALVLRDLRLKYRGSRIGFFVVFIQPIVVIVAHYYFFLALRKPMPANLPIEIFVIAGFSVWYTFNYTAYGLMTGKKGPAAAVAIPGVTPMHRRVAKSLWQLLANLSLCLTAVIPLRLCGDAVPFPAVPSTVLIFLLAGSLGFGFGLLLEALGMLLPSLDPFKKILIWSLFITSGIYFSISQTNLTLAEIFWYNPMLHLLEWQRHAFDPGYPIAHVTLLYPAAWALGLIVAGLLTLRCARHPDRD